MKRTFGYRTGRFGYRAAGVPTRRAHLLEWEQQLKQASSEQPTTNMLVAETDAPRRHLLRAA